MKKSVLAIAGLVAALFTAADVLAAGQHVNTFSEEKFNDRIAQYMAIRHEVEQHVPPPALSANAADIVAVQETLARTIRKARPRAQPGDILGGAVDADFRSRIQRALVARDVSASALARSLDHDEEQRPAALTINGSLDWRAGATMPAIILDALPPVPWPLQYRLVCGDLVLLDVDAGLIVDILPGALQE